MSDKLRLENWSIVAGSLTAASPYVPPEARLICLQGEVYNHPNFPNGTDVVTSFVRGVEGREVTTYSGSVYTLGYPNPEFVEWCKKEGCHVPTENEPVIIHTTQ